MPCRSLRAFLPCALLAAVVLAGCPAEDESTPPAVPPTYPPADVADLILHDGGTGGGPNMGGVTVVLFDAETPATRVSGATVLVRHGAQEARATTDAQGEAAFTGLTPGAVTVTALAVGYVNATVVDVNAAAVVMGMKAAYVRVEGRVQGFTAGNRVVIELETKVKDELDSKVSEKFGRLVSQTPISGRVDYVLRFQARATDNLVVTEIDTAPGPTQGKVLRRKKVAFGPWTTDQVNTAVTNINLDNATGLFEVTFAVHETLAGAGTVVAWYEENYNRFWSWSSVSTSATTWTVRIQIPANLAGAVVVLETYGSGSVPGDDLPAESWERTVNTGTAELGSTDVVNLTMVDLGGDVQNAVYPGDLFFILATYRGRTHGTLGVQLAGDDYAIRIPNGVTTEFRVLEIHNPTSTGGTIVADKTATANYSADVAHHFDMAGSATSALALTSNLPVGMTDPAGICLLTGVWIPSGAFLSIPYMAVGQVQGAQLAWDLRYTTLGANVDRFLLVVIAQDAALPEEQAAKSILLRGNLADPGAALGTAVTLALLDPPRVLAPADGATVARASLQFAWLADSAVAVDGVFQFDVVDADGAPVWSFVCRGTTTQFALPPLPTDRSAFDLNAAGSYSFRVGSTLIPGLDFDAFTVDTMPADLAALVDSDDVLKMAESRASNFQVN